MIVTSAIYRRRRRPVFDVVLLLFISPAVAVEPAPKRKRRNCTGTALELHWNCTGTARSVKNTQKCSEFLRLEICPETALPEEHTETALKLLGQLKTLRSALKVL